MIRLHRLNGHEMVVNADLIESVDAHGQETVLAMANGNKVVVRESIEEVIHKSIEYKKTVFAGAVYLPDHLRGEKERNASCPSR